ncbi:hypothetical protein IAT38_002499 [Cryptococcus sp. DSM 104549]
MSDSLPPPEQTPVAEPADAVAAPAPAAEPEQAEVPAAEPAAAAPAEAPATATETETAPAQTEQPPAPAEPAVPAATDSTPAAAPAPLPASTAEPAAASPVTETATASTPAAAQPSPASAPAPALVPAAAAVAPAPAAPALTDDEKRMEVIKGMDVNRVNFFRQRVTDLQAAGATKETSAELAKMTMILDLYDRAKKMEADKQTSPSTATSGGANGTTPANGATPAPAPAGAHVSMTPTQIAQLRTQAAAFQNLSKGQPVPSYMLAAAQGTPPPGIGGTPAVKEVQDAGVEGRVVDKVVEAVVGDNLEAREKEKEGDKGTAGETAPMEVDAPVASGSGSTDVEKVVTPPAPAEAIPEIPSGPPYAMEFDESSLIYPYNAYTHPSLYANRRFDDEIANPLGKRQRLVAPSVMPQGLDPLLLMEERNRFVETRMSWRMKELEEMEATRGMGVDGAQAVANITDIASSSSDAGANGDAKPAASLAPPPTDDSSAGIRARIELMSLRLVNKQRLLREDVVRAMHGGSQVPADRSQFRRFRTHQIRDARATEQNERRQRTEREQRGKQRHLAYVSSICDHGAAMVAAGVGSSKGAGAEKMKKLGRGMMRLHAETEREEQKRIERLAKERLKALRNDDEEAYLALLGEAKDSRISHLMDQTDQYLETLAAAVVEQQNDDVHRDQILAELPFEQEEGMASEEMFGARRQDGEDADAERRAGKVDYYAVAHKLQEKVTSQASLLTGGTLKDYQVKGLQWMISLYNNRLNGILADEMGLGKTIQTISLITYLIERKKQPGPFLVIVPLSTLTNWTLEFERWAPAVRTLILKGSPAVRKEAYPRLRAGDFQVCLTTYEYIIKERPMLSRIKWIHMIIDEGHRMKNVKSKLSQTLNEHYTSRYRLILTGTPLQNNLPELWALLNFVLPKIFNSVKSFDEWFNAPFANTGGEKMEMNEEEALLVVKRLHKVLRPFLLRRLKKDVESELPDKVEKVIYTKMSALQWKLYESVQKYKTLPTDMTAAKPQKRQNLQNALMQLRKICNHPYVFREVDEDFTVGNTTDEQIIRVAGKFELLDRILPKLFKTGHKVLIFFQMTEIMTIVSDFFDYRGWKYCRLDGSTKADDRQTLLSTFNDPNSPYQVFILSTRAGGLGLNLQSADTVIIYDTDWNPHADLQAQDRAHRIGQKKEVRVLRLISSGTVEELVLARAQRKLEIDGKVIQAGKFDDVTTGAEYEALLQKAFETSADDEEEETNELDDDELNELLARGDHELELFAQMDKERKERMLADWRAKGHKEELRPALMQESELPPFYRRDIGQEMALQIANEEEQGRGRRQKQEVRYTDGLTDDQFLAALENSDDDVEEAADRKRKRADKKAERKRMNELLAEAEAEGKPLDVNAIKGVVAPGGADEGSVGEEPSPQPASKKKRPRPSASVTPSLAGDDAAPTKRRKVGGKDQSEDRKLMYELFAETNELKSDLGENLNQFFLVPVNKRDYPDYYQLIQRPIAMSQIRSKLSKPNYTLPALRADLHLLWDNARTYNQEGSWVYTAAEDMQEAFDRMWEEKGVPELLQRLQGGGGAGGGGSGSVSASAGPSGTSTPMFKSAEKVTAPKIRISMSKKKVEAAKEEEEDEESDDDEAMDGDDY